MLGSVTEAEDVVQEALLRVHRALESGEQIASPRAFTATVTTRLAMDELRSARARRERYVGDWLPEPILTDGRVPVRTRPAHAETADSLSMALLVLLESLSPEQRAVLLLHDVFGYGYDEITTIVGKSEANVRQLASRARRARRGPPAPVQHDSRAAERAGEALLHRSRARATSPGSSRCWHTTSSSSATAAARSPSLARSQRGRSRVAHTLTNWLRALRRLPEMEIRLTEVNGDPGAMFLVEGPAARRLGSRRPRTVEVAGVRAMVNPDKLVHLGPVGDANALIRRLGGSRPGD